MTGETLADILSGGHERTRREDLHDALDALLDAADEDSGRLDSPAFWAFVADLARGRGIADEIADTSARHMLADGPLPEFPLDDPARAPKAALVRARMAQWAMLAAVMRRITAFPGEIVPHELRAAMFIAVADNIVAGRGELGKGEHLDLLGFGTQRGSLDQAERRAARQILVGAVLFEAARNGGTNRAIGKARKELLRGQVSTDTFKGWIGEVRKAKRTTRAKLLADFVTEVGDGAYRYPNVLSEDEIGDLLRRGHFPND